MLLFVDGFDHVGGTSNLNVGTKWDVAGYMPVTPTTTRTGPYAANGINGSAEIYTKPLNPVPNGGCVVGLAYQMLLHNYVAGQWYDLIQIRESTSVHMALTMDQNRKLVVRRGTTNLATGSISLNTKNWYYIEMKVMIDSIAGSYEVRVDGVSDPALTASGINTRNGGATGQWTTIRMSTCSSAEFYIDDFYVCDTSGPAPQNDFLGTIKIETLFPQTDAVAGGPGTYAAFTPSIGTDHGALVDENPPNTTDYNASAVIGARDTYNYPSMALTGTVLGVQTNMYCAKSDTSGRQICSMVRTGGQDREGAPRSLTTAFTYFTERFPLNPVTGVAWTIAEIAALQVGLKIVS